VVLKGHNGRALLSDVRAANGAGQRTRGLLGRREIGGEEGLLIGNCRCVHTFMMKFPIGLIYLDKTLRVSKIVRRLKPWRVSFCRAAESVVECRADSPALNDLRVGEKITLEEQSK
jgi:hypothetical protein